MSKYQTLRALVTERLAAAAEDIFVLFERTIAEYEEELCRSKEENQRTQQDELLYPRIELVRGNFHVPSSPEPGLNQDLPEFAQIKEEPEEKRVKQEDDKLPVFDAAQEDGSLGRLVNDQQHPNCKMQRIINEANPHLCLFALNDIQPEENITFDCGGNDCPWRTKTEDQPHTAKSSESHLSRSIEMTPVSSPVLDIPTLSPSSDCNLTITDQSTPRSKSIEMRGHLDYDSGELFDPISDDRGEVYIPNSGQDPSEDTDLREISRADQKINKLGFPSTSNMVDTGKESQSLPELDSTINSTSEKGRSNVRKQNRSRRRCSSKRVTGPIKENSACNPEQNLPCSEASPCETDGSLLSIPAVCKKDDGSRMYNKKQYCLYCKEGVIKIARHLERAHQDEAEVASAFSFPKNSKERRMQLEQLRNKGNFSHNVEVLSSGVGNLVVRKRPNHFVQAEDYLHCSYCQGLFRRTILSQHSKHCKFKPGILMKPGSTCIQAPPGFATPPPAGTKAEQWKVLNNMFNDDVFHAVKSDTCIIEYGEHLYNRVGGDPRKHEYIRQKMRELGRLLLCSRKNTHLKTIKEHIKPANFQHVVQAVKEMAGYDSEKDTYSCPSLPLKIGYSLNKVSLLVESHAKVTGDDNEVKEAQTFRRIYKARWNELVLSASVRTLQESKWNTLQLLPFTKDVQTLHSFLDAKQQDLFHKLSSATSLQTYTQLTKVILTQIILFNRCRSGEVSKIPLSAYTSHSVSDSQEDGNVALSDLEKRLYQHFRRLEIRGKCGGKVPLLLTPAMQQTLDLLVSKREECGILTENTYLFARPSSLTCYRGSFSLRYFASVCGAKSPESLTSTKLCKQIGTLSQVLHLSNTELDQLADYLGRDIRVNRQFYRLPEGTLQLAKISKLLLALEQGRLAAFNGKSLDDINIDPEENVHLDSDQDGDPVNSYQPESGQDSDHESDLLERPVTRSNKTGTVHTAPEENTVKTTQVTDAHQGRTRLKGSKARPFRRRKKWNKEEVAAVERHMMTFITKRRVPGKRDCDECIRMENNALENRDWLAIKFYVKNRITALKTKK